MPAFSTRDKILLFLGLVALIVGARLIPHLPNFAPVAASALVATVYLGRRWGVAVALVGMVLSDIFIGFYDGRLMAVVYGSFVMIAVFGGLLKRYYSPLNVISASLLSSLFFFLVTNLAVWAFSPWYSKDLTGLFYCFTLALPFFRYTLAGDLFYTALLFPLFHFFFYWRFECSLNSSLVLAASQEYNKKEH